MPHTLEQTAPEARDAFLELLKEIAADPARRVYAVVDGAQIDDLPTRLETAGPDPDTGLAHVPLVQGEDYSVILAGPWLVSPYVYALSAEDRYETLPDGSVQQKEDTGHRRADPVRQLELLFAVLEDPRRAAFWIGDDTLTPDALFAHLRGLGQVRAAVAPDPENRTPPGAAGNATSAGGTAPAGGTASAGAPRGQPESPHPLDTARTAADVAPPGPHHPGITGGTAPAGDAASPPPARGATAATPATEARPADARPEDLPLVYFRHADANALAQIIPALDTRQVTRLLGPAELLVALPHPAWSETALALPRPRSTGAPPVGPLVLDARTMAGIEAPRRTGFARKIAAYLRKVSPARTATLTGPALVAFAERSMADAERYGVTSEAAHCRWAFMTLASGGDFSRSPEVQHFMTVPSDTPLSPDDRVKMLMKGAIQIIRNASPIKKGG